jgi:hypothetical protein
MNVEIGAEAVLFPEKEYINGIAVAVCSRICPIENIFLTNVLSIGDNRATWTGLETEVAKGKRWATYQVLGRTKVSRADTICQEGLKPPGPPGTGRVLFMLNGMWSIKSSRVWEKTGAKKRQRPWQSQRPEFTTEATFQNRFKIWIKSLPLLIPILNFCEN